MTQNIRIRLVPKDLFNPVILIDRVEGHSNLIELTRRQLSTQTVINDFHICLCQFGCFLTPHIRQLAFLEGDGLQLFTLLFIVHATEDDFIAVDLACQLQWALCYLPIQFSLIPEHAINSAGQFCKGAVTVCDVGLADADQVAAFVRHQPQNIVLGSVHALSGTGTALHNDVSFIASVNFLEAWIGLHFDFHSSSP